MKTTPRVLFPSFLPSLNSSFLHSSGGWVISHAKSWKNSIISHVLLLISPGGCVLNHAQSWKKSSNSTFSILHVSSVRCWLSVFVSVCLSDILFYFSFLLSGLFSLLPVVLSVSDIHIKFWRSEVPVYLVLVCLPVCLWLVGWLVGESYTRTWQNNAIPLPFLISYVCVCVYVSSPSVHHICRMYSWTI